MHFFYFFLSLCLFAYLNRLHLDEKQTNGKPQERERYESQLLLFRN